MTFGGFLSSLFRPKPQQAPPPPAPAPTAAPIPLNLGVRLYRVATVQGGWVSVQPSTNLLGIGEWLDPAFAVVAMMPAAMPGLCLLAAPDGRMIAVEGDPLAAVALSARVLPTDQRGLVRLRSPLNEHRFLTAVAPGTATGHRHPGRVRPHEAGELRFMPESELRWDGDGNSMPAVFGLSPMNDANAPAGLRAILTEVVQAAADGLSAAALVARLRSGALRPELAEPLIRAMPPDEMEDLARRALDNPLDCRLLRFAMPADPWVRAILPALAAWNFSRAPRAPITDSPVGDETLLLPPQGYATITAGLALTALARRQVLPRRTACLLATARNEGPYLLDWVSYHLSIGFEDIFLYSNDNADGSDALLELLANHGVIRWIRNARGTLIGPQDKAYAHALTMVPEILEYRWAAILDLDEYLGFDTNLFGGVADFIAMQEAQKVDAIAMSWLMFGAAADQRWSAESSLTRFAYRTPDINLHVKSMCRPKLFWYSQPHFPTASMGGLFTYRTADGSLHHHPGVKGRIPAFAEAPRADHAWINHYFARTAEESLWKLARGRANWVDDTDNGDYVRLVTRAVTQMSEAAWRVEDKRILACAAGQGAVLERLRALPGVADCDDALKAQFGAALQGVRRNFLAGRPGADEPEFITRFRNMLSEAQG
jgi:hypothetical protein